MKRLNYTILCEIREFDSIVSSKRTSRKSLKKLKRRVKPFYRKYLKKFTSIHNLGVSPFTLIEKNDLKNCYENSTKALEALKKTIIDCQEDKFKFLCPYCLIINHTTFDHFIPKEDYPVFSVCPKNLIPCCSSCNTKKLQYWRENGQKAIIHFYNDDINGARFLYCDIEINNGIPTLAFRLQFEPNFNSILRFTIEKHFERLELIERYKTSSSDLISEVYTDVYSILGTGNITKLDLKTFLLKKARQYFNMCGDNYWFALGYQTLAQSEDFMDTLPI